jgi:hypothetical protein
MGEQFFLRRLFHWGPLTALTIIKWITLGRWRDFSEYRRCPLFVLYPSFGERFLKKMKPNICNFFSVRIRSVSHTFDQKRVNLFRRKKLRKKIALLWIRIDFSADLDLIPAFYLDVDPNPYPDQTNACGSGSRS